ncbi:conserved hypothetical protein [Leishmania major strain Friedlin]|uniref:Uncharacterized protein n=1 Tax=Leishmania major TaxID=5664 RepID=Q4Q0Z8_LEIMA|nr:conserved hypothetical protein [Leishmania major strain Friedlin]CAG9583963.1 hypothetical_protein_-_conserved [Leishmania major strain Friedlin]CAJ09383.1 conserved hypothetical protein [Leishmania major strain Friedlin]|eukprot:XP_001687000.1 conserved hypothetical protein [Leishmania major strain Friedlin]
MSKNKRPRLAKKAGKASHGKRKRATSLPAVAPDHRTPRVQHAESTPAAPKSIEDVARLFIGVGRSSDNGDKAYASTESISLQMKKAKGSMKRLREGAENGTGGRNSSMKRQKGSTTGALSFAITNNTVTLERKARRQPKVAERCEDDDDEEDVELSKAVQAQTLSFLQHLNSKSSKTFWELRDVAQGKLSAASATTATSSSSQLPSSSRTKAAKGNAKGAKKLADDGEELWRVGGPYISGDQADDTDESERECGRTSDSELQSSTSSSEPSWVTDSSEEEDGGGSDDEAESAPVAAGATSRRSAAEPPKRGGGGGRLFQGGGDGVWDED